MKKKKPETEQSAALHKLSDSPSEESSHHAHKPEERERLIVYGLYTSFIKNIKHFDNLQTFYRILTSTILLSTFVAIGFIFSVKTQELSLNNFLIVVFICAVGWVSVIALWHLDLIFYERLLASSFKEVLNLEENYRWLPKVHHNMLYGIKPKKGAVLGMKKHSGGINKPANIVSFYIGCSVTFIIIAGIASMFMLQFAGMKNLIIHISLAILTILIIALNTSFLKTRTGNIQSALKAEVN